MSIKKGLAPLTADQDVDSIEYKTVQLDDIKLDIADNAQFLVTGVCDPGVVLSDAGLKDLCEWLKVPWNFANRLKEKGQSHIISYLQRQLSQGWREEVEMVTSHADRKMPEVIAFSKKEDIPFHGSEVYQIDRRLFEEVEADGHLLELTGRTVHQTGVHYDFFLKQEHALANDPDPLWKWGYSLDFSFTGAKAPTFTSTSLRLACANMNYIPEDTFNFPILFEPEFELQAEEVIKFFKELPTPQWALLDNYIKRARKIPTSLGELKRTRSTLRKALMLSKHDTETGTKIDEALRWKEVEREYGLETMKEEGIKRSAKWYARATTPLSIFDTYNFITQSATRLPNDFPFDTRMSLLIGAGGLLAGKSDLVETPPLVTWKPAKKA